MNKAEHTSLEQYRKRHQILIKKNIFCDTENSGTLLRKITNEYPNIKSRKTYLASILGLEKVGEIKLSPDVSNLFKTQVMALNNDIYKQDSKQVLHEKYADKWLTNIELLDIKKQIDAIDFENMTITPQLHWELEKWIVFYLYVQEHPPLRCDYCRTCISTHAREGFNQYNYKTGEFFIRKFKTDKTNEPIYFKTSERFKNRVKLLLLFRKKLLKYNITKEQPLLLTKTCLPMSRVVFLTMTKEIFGKQIGSTMLRRIYLSYRFPVKKNETLEDRKLVAKQMGNSVNVQNIYIKQVEQELKHLFL